MIIRVGWFVRLWIRYLHVKSMHQSTTLTPGLISRVDIVCSQKTQMKIIAMLIIMIVMCTSNMSFSRSGFLFK